MIRDARRAGVLVTLALTAVLTGCGGGEDDGPAEGAGPSSSPSPSTSPPPPPSPSPSVSPSSASPSAPGKKPGTDPKACFDGTCEIALSKPTAIEVDSRFGVSNLEVSRITSDAVTVQSEGGGTFLSSSLGEGGTGGLNGLGFRVKSVDGGTAVLEFFPKN